MTQRHHPNGHVTDLPRRDRFASGATTRLPLSDGDWVLVRAELTYGQQRRLATAGVKGLPAGMGAPDAADGLSVDWAAFDIERLCTWVVDWSFVDGDGGRVVVSREAIEALQPDTATEIQKALDGHIAELEAKKGGPTGGSSSAATSSSATATAGRGRS